MDNTDLLAGKFLAQEFPLKSSLISRLQKFIPELSAANEQLDKEKGAVDIGISIEPVPKDDKEESSSGSSEESNDESDGSEERDEHPRIEFDMHIIGDHSSEDEEESSKNVSLSTGPKNKLIEEID